MNKSKETRQSQPISVRIGSRRTWRSVSSVMLVAALLLGLLGGCGAATERGQDVPDAEVPSGEVSVDKSAEVLPEADISSQEMTATTKSTPEEKLPANGEDAAQEAESSRLYPFMEDAPSSYADALEATDALAKLCMERPEVLASTMSAFPNAVQELYSDSYSDPVYLNSLMRDGDACLDAYLLLDAALHGNILRNALVNLTTWSGKADVLYLTDASDDSEETSSDTTFWEVTHEDGGENSTTAIMIMSNDYDLTWVTEELENAPILIILKIHDDGTHDIGRFLLSGGFQRIVPIEDD